MIGELTLAGLGQVDTQTEVFLTKFGVSEYIWTISVSELRISLRRHQERKIPIPHFAGCFGPTQQSPTRLSYLLDIAKCSHDSHDS